MSQTDHGIRFLNPFSPCRARHDDLTACSSGGAAPGKGFIDLTSQKEPESKEPAPALTSLALLYAQQERARRSGAITVITGQQALLLESVALLAQSETASALLREARSEGWRVGFENLEGYDFHIDMPERFILLSPGAEEGGTAPVALCLIKALRDIWQEKRFPLEIRDYAPEAILMLERVRAADCDVVAALTAAELRALGQSLLWDALARGDESDLLAPLSVPQAAQNKTALHALARVFELWHHDKKRVDACDHQTLEYLDDVLQAHHDAHPDFTPAFGARKPGVLALELFSCLPSRSAYLAGRGQEILRDPLYAGLHDPINQSHLMQIMHDGRAVKAGGVAFRDAVLAARIFPARPQT